MDNASQLGKIPHFAMIYILMHVMSTWKKKDPDQQPANLGPKTDVAGIGLRRPLALPTHRAVQVHLKVELSSVQVPKSGRN